MYSVWYKRPDGEVVRINSKTMPTFSLKDGRYLVCKIDKFSFGVDISNFCYEHTPDKTTTYDDEMDELLQSNINI